MSSNKSPIRKVSGFNITIRGVEHEGFKKVDTWNGLACYQNHQGKVIATDVGGDPDLFGGMFGDIFDLDSKEVVLVMCDDCFMPPPVKNNDLTGQS